MEIPNFSNKEQLMRFECIEVGGKRLKVDSEGFVLLGDIAREISGKQSQYYRVRAHYQSR
jgi:hypothetical protein